MIIPRPFSIFVWLLVFSIFITIAYLLVNTTYMPYDDEGYVLRSLQGYLSGHRLYDEVFSQYGPAPYLYHQLITYITQQPLTHTLGRSLTILHWSACALFAGLITQTITRNQVVSVCASVTVFGLLWQMSSEPTHPGSMLSFGLSMLTWLAVKEIQTGKTWILAAIGAGAAALFLTKVNIGLLFCTSLAAIMLRHGNWPDKWRQPARSLAALGLVILPWGLMSSKLHEPWVLIFAIQFSCAVIALLWVCPVKSDGFPAKITSTLFALATGFLIGLFIIVGVILINGSSLTGLIHAVLLDPLRHPANFLLGFTWIAWVWPISFICWAVALFSGLQLRNFHQVTSVTRNLIIVIRLATLVVLIINAQNWLTIYGVGRFIAVCLPLAILFLIPLNAREQTDLPISRKKEFLALLALPQVLHAFPVAGSQMGWGTFLLIPVFAAGLNDAVESIETSARNPIIRRYVKATIWSIIFSISIFQTCLLAYQGWSRYSTSQPLNLPGAYNIRIPEPTRQMIRLLCLNTEIHADLLFSKPGMFSYNIWTNTPTPSEANATHWFWLLNPEKQKIIINRLAQQPRSVIIVNHPLDVFVQKLGISTSGTLSTFINTNYKALLESADFSLLIPNSSKAVAFGKIVATTAEDAPPDKALKLQVCLPINGSPVKIKFTRNIHPWAEYISLDPQNAQISLTPIDRNGQTIGPSLEWPVHGKISGLYRVTIYTHQLPLESDAAKLIFSILDPDKTALAEAIF